MTVTSTYIHNCLHGLPVMRELLDFLLAEIVAREGDRWYIRQIEGADENIDRVNDTAHLLTLVRALHDFGIACRVLGLPQEPRYTEAAVRLRGDLRDARRHSCAARHHQPPPGNA